MKHASEALREEHEMILFGLHILEEMASRLSDAQLVETEDLADLLAFFRRFADSLHLGKEERLYFPALEKAGLKQSGEPIDTLLLDHEAIRSNLERMEEALTGRYLPDELAAAATDYISLFRDHVDREDRLVFGLGDERLAPADQDALLEAFGRFEADGLGEGVRDDMHERLACLDRKYPN